MEIDSKDYLSGDKDLLQESVIILLKGVQLSLFLGLSTQLSILDNLRMEVAICGEKDTHEYMLQKLTQHDILVSGTI